jgi:hypothetical protein
MNYTRGNMKIKGKKIEGPNTQYVVIPRGDGEDIVFEVKAIMDMSPFDKLCPQPKPPKKMLPGGQIIVNVEDPNFKAELNDWAAKRAVYITLSSLEPSQIEWDTVKLDNPSTWSNYQKDLVNAGFSDFEIGRIINATLEVNCLDESKVEQARQRFLASMQAPKNVQNSQMDDQPNMQSGVPAKDSESNHQVSHT